MKTTLLFLFLFLSSSLAFTQHHLGPRYKTVTLDPNYEHTKWGIEPADLIYEFAAYTTSFDSEDDNDGDGKGECWGIPEWVAYEVKKETDLTADKYSRPTWMTDTALNRKGIVPNDDTYLVSGTNQLPEVKDSYRYVRGHLCPKDAADRMGINAGWNTHTMLNAAPQLQWQNNGIWKDLEEDITDWADHYGSVWVICGPVFFGKTPAVWLGQNDEVRAAVPDAFYKIVIRKSDESESGIETLSFLIPNVIPKAEDDLSDFIVHMGRLQELTGLSFLTQLSEEARTFELNRNSNSADHKTALERWH